MDYGSSHVWVYDFSDEEYFSETELQEGMWLSDSDRYGNVSVNTKVVCWLYYQWSQTIKQTPRTSVLACQI